MRFQGTGFARLDKDSLGLQSIAAFAQPLVPRRELPCCDKNWGVLEIDNELYIIYTVLPCLTLFRLDSEHDNSAAFVYASCLTNQATQHVAAATGLEMRDVRISGHPVVMSQYPQTLLVMVHHNWRKQGGSKHWLVQLQFDTKRNNFLVSAVSQVPILNHEDYILYGDHVQNVIAVGSYHLFDGNLRILYGEGDKYAAFVDVNLSDVTWVYLDRSQANDWEEGLGLALGDKIDSITYIQYKSMIW